MQRVKVQFSTFSNLFLGILLLVLGSVIGFNYGQKNPGAFSFSQLSSILTNTAQPAERETVDFATFWEVWSLLERDYLEPEKIVPKTMVNGAISGMASALGDPYTTYLPPVENQRRGEDLAGSFYGVGIELGFIDGTLAVVAPLKNTPADKAGVEAGDLILHVKDESKDVDSDTAGWSLNEAVNTIRGKRGTNVVLTLLRKDAEGNNREPFEVTIARDEIVVESVDLTFVEHAGKRVAHLKLSSFGDRTEGEWNQAVVEILAQQPKVAGVILDMRNNPGGYFDGAIMVASEFFAKGLVVSQKGKFSSQDFNATGRARLSGFPVEVLVNRGSASASEIVAGALRDQKGAKLIGEKTFGKGTVQDRHELDNGGGLHVTIARWLLPKGEWIHDTGIPVNVEVHNDPETEQDEVLLKAIEEL